MAQKKKKKPVETDLRKLPKDKRPKPSSGQSAEAFQLPTEDLSKAETKLVSALNGKGSGLRETIGIGQLAKSLRMTPLEVRNSVRRLVPSGWVERVDEVLTDDGETASVRGHYRLTEKARKRLS